MRAPRGARAAPEAHAREQIVDLRQQLQPRGDRIARAEIHHRARARGTPSPGMAGAIRLVPGVLVAAGGSGDSPEERIAVDQRCRWNTGGKDQLEDLLPRLVCEGRVDRRTGRHATFH